jgi:hypothetical protein
VAATLRINKGRLFKYLVWMIISFILFSLVFYSSCNSEKQIDREWAYLNHEPSVSYVGIEKCSECHADKHSTFIHTGMGLSFDSATRKKSSAQFGPQHMVFDTTSGLFYLPFWRDEELYIKEFSLSGKDTTHTLDKKINYIVGSGQHTNSHLIQENGYIFQAPITYYVQEEKWDLAPGFETENSRFNRILSSECISCHNAMPKMINGSDFKYEEIGNGIDCERCHGPGELHVKEREAGLGVDVKQEIDRTIVNPRKLSWERQIDVCQRCHLQGLNLLKEGKKFTDFKPGMVLSNVFDIYLPEYEGDHSPFDMANHSDRFQRSACFINSNSESLEFTCISCHNPHVSIKSTQVAVYNTVCQNCHKTDDCTEESIVLETKNYDCVSCHMPQSGSEDIPHVTVHDHYIRIPEEHSDVKKVQKLVGLYAVNNSAPSITDKARAYLEYWEKFDKNPFYLQQATNLIPEVTDLRVHLKYYYLKEQFEQVATLDLDDYKLSAWEQFMLARSYLKTDRVSLGLYALENAFKKDPTQVLIAEELAKNLINNGELDKASQYLKELLLEFPSNGRLFASKSKLLILQNKLALVNKPLSLATKLEPNDINIWFIWLNYAVKKRDKKLFSYWAQRIRKQEPERLTEQDMTSILETL